MRRSVFVLLTCGQSAFRGCKCFEVRQFSLRLATRDKLIVTRLRRLLVDGTDTVVKEFLAEFGTMPTGKVCTVPPEGVLFGCLRQRLKTE